MEVLVTIRNINKYNTFKSLADGIIVGSLFTSGYHLSRNEMRQLRISCLNDGKKYYVVIDDFICESDKSSFFDYFDFVVSLKPDGIYYHDMAVMAIARKYGLLSKLIYDGKTIICNSLETAFYLNTGIDSLVLSRELTLDEIKPIIINNAYRVDMQIFGHLRMSYSKRKFLTNYFHEIGSNYDYSDSEKLTLTEENRDYHMPIVQDDSGTKIYSDYILETYNELPELKKYLKHGIVDTYFIEDSVVTHFLRDVRRINDINAAFLKNGLVHNDPELYSSGYLYTKTNKTKDGKD